MTGYNQRDSSLDTLLIIGIVIAGAAGLWFWWRESIIFLGFALALMSVSPFVMLATVLSWLDISMGPLLLVMEVWNLLTREPWHNIHDYFIPVMTIGGRCLALLVLPSLVLAYLGSSRLRPDVIFRQRHDLESAIRALGGIWSCANWLTKVNPAREPETAVPDDQIARTRNSYDHWQTIFNRHQGAFPRQDRTLSGSWLLPTIDPPYQPPPFGRALRPEEWLAAHGINRDEVDLMVTVDVLLARQLGRKWIGWEGLQPHEQALLAVLVLIDGGQTSAAERLTDALMNMMAMPDQGRDFSVLMAKRKDIRVQVETILSGHTERIAQISVHHFWVSTVLAETWIRCREGKGVWPSARYQWLKTVDRALWYTISSLGSHAVFVESSGILAHHLAERQLAMPLAVPRVRRASEAIVYDYLDQSPERIRARKTRQKPGDREVPGHFWSQNPSTGGVNP